jgi:RNA polymerase sigma-70 factor (ECF subfamily)
LTIVRNTCYTWLRKNRLPAEMLAGATARTAEVAADPATEPEVRILRDADRHLVRHALDALPTEFREVLSSAIEDPPKEIADIIDAPLAPSCRAGAARARLQQGLVERMRGRHEHHVRTGPSTGVGILRSRAGR